MPKNLSLFNYHTNIFLLMNIFFSEWNLKNGPGTNSRRFPPKLRIKIHTPGNHYVHPPTCKIMINDNISLISIWQGNLKKKNTILVMPRRTDQQQHLRSNIQYFLRSNIHTKKAYRMLHLISCAAHAYRGVTWRSKAWMSILKIYWHQTGHCASHITGKQNV